LVASLARYRVVLLAISLAALAYVQRVAISQAAGSMQAELGLGKEQFGLVFGAFGLAYALFEVPNGLLGDRFGVRATLTRLVVAWSVLTALTGATWNLVSLWVARFLFGATEAGCFPNLTRMLSAWLPPRARLRAQALMWACSRWAGAVTPPLVFWLVQWHGWRVAFVALAGLGLVWTAIFFPWFRDDPAQHRSVNAEELALLQQARELTTQQGARHWHRSLLSVPVLLLALQYFCFSFVWYFYVTWLPTYLAEARHTTGQEAAWLATLPLAFGGIGSLAAGYAAARLPQRGIAIVGFLLAAGLLLLVTRIASTPLAMVAMGLASFCCDLTMPISWNTCVEIGRRHTATLSGAMNMFGNLAGFVAPVLGGAILKHAPGNWNLLIYLMAGAALGASACWVFLAPAGAASPAAAGGTPSRLLSEGDP
jgi:MFS family permease